MAKVKITVVKTMTTKEIFGKELTDEVKEGVNICQKLKEGQEFIYDGSIPKGFCPWAWHDIQREIYNISIGNSYPWILKQGLGYFCCNDALRPVIFRVEKTE